MAPAAIASAASALGWLVLMPTSSGPPPKSTSISSQLWASLRLGLSDFDSHTRARRIEADHRSRIGAVHRHGFARRQHDVGEEALVAFDQRRGQERSGE